MYVIVRTMKTEKNFQQTFKSQFESPFILQDVDGFIKREVLLDSKNKDFDIFKVSIYFESREAYINWESSDLHKSMHKDKKEKKEIPGLIEANRETYLVISTTLHH